MSEEKLVHPMYGPWMNERIPKRVGLGGAKEVGTSQRIPTRKKFWFDIMNEAKATRKQKEGVAKREGVEWEEHGKYKNLMNLVSHKEKERTKPQGTGSGRYDNEVMEENEFESVSQNRLESMEITISERIPRLQGTPQHQP